MKKCWKRMKFTAVVMIFVMTLSSCGAPGQTDPDENGKELTLQEIEALADTGVFNVNWSMVLGDYMAGTSFLIDSKEHGMKLMITAYHYLEPETVDKFDPIYLPDYIHGGELYYARSGKDTGASLKCELVLPDADAVPVISKDAAAFSIRGDEALKTLPLSERKPKEGEQIYLLAKLTDGDVRNQNCVYECQVVSCGNDQIIYLMDPKYGSTMGASGAPLVDKYGKVIGMHMAGDGKFFYGHVTESFMKQIDNGYFSEKIFSPLETP